jgi:hypothetical protein
MSTILHPSTNQQSVGSVGMASFVLGAMTLASFVLLSTCAIAFNATGAIDKVIGFALSLIWMAAIIGSGLGVTAIIRHQVRKIFPTLGVTMNVTVIVVSVALILIGVCGH